MMTEQTRIVLAKTLDVVDLAGEKAMIDFETGKYFLLKGAANDIWDYIQAEISVTEIVGNLLEIYDVDKNVCLQSTVDFLEQLDRNGFISYME